MPCILKDDIKKLHNAIKDKGGLSALRGMTADERINFFADYIDMKGHTETAEWFNRELESRLFIPNQIQATKDWIKRLEQKGRPIKQQKALIDRISAKKDVMSPKESRQYMESVAKQVMGFEIDRADAKKLFDLSTSINQLKKKLLAIRPDYYELKADDLAKLDDETLQTRQELGAKLVEFQKTYEDISLKAQDAVAERGGKLQKAGASLSKVAGNIKSLKASVDFSFLRQLQSTAYVNFDSFKNALKAGYKAWFESPQGVDTMLADLLTRPNALNGNYDSFGIEVGIKEEAFPESWLSEKLGETKLNLLRRSDAAFNIALQTARANLFDWMWERSNGDVKLLKTQKVGDAINTITGRGKVPLLVSKDETQNRIVNNMLFAPKWLASRIQTLADIRYIGQIGKLTPQGIRARSAVGNLIMLAVFANVVKAALWALDDDDERDIWEFLESTFDPRSTEFGKIRVGTTRFDLSTGTAGLVTLFSRLLSGQTVTLSGVKTDIDRWKVLGNFIKGKGSPFISDVLQLATNTDYFGKDRKWDTAGEIASNVMDFLAPISISSAYETARNAELGKTEGIDTWAAAGGVLADIVGVSANTYDTADKDLGKSSKAIKMEQKIAWATNKQPISAKLASNTVIMRDAPADKTEQYQLEFAEILGRQEDKLMSTSAFKSASLEERDEMLHDLRSKVYADFKKAKGFGKKTVEKKKKKK